MAEGNQEQRPNKPPGEAAFDLVPDVRESDLIRQSERMGIVSYEDSCWGMVECYALCQAAARESAAAARSVSTNVDNLQKSLAQVPSDATKAVLDAGRSSAEEVQQSIRAVAQEQIDATQKAIRSTIQDEYEKAENRRIEKLESMLDRIDEKAAATAKKYRKQLETDIEKSIEKIGRAQANKNQRRSALSWVGAILLGVAITAGGGVYVWHAYGQHQLTFSKQVKESADHCFYSKKHHAYYCRLTAFRHH